jgi:hypothetical protein
MKGIKLVVGILLVLVMLGSLVDVVSAEKDIISSISKVNINSPNDAFNLQKIREEVKRYSQEEIKKKYEKAVKESHQQYIKALQEIEKYKSSIKNYSSDDDKTLIGTKSYYHRDDTADGGISAHGGSGIGYSDAWINGNEIHVWSRAEAYGDYWAHGRVWDRFTYNADDHWCKVKVQYHLRGRLMALSVGPGAAENEIKIYLRVYDVTENKEVEKKLIFSGSGNHYYDNILLSGSVYAYLKKGHTYDVELIAESSADAYGEAGALSDFGYWEFDGDWRWVKWDYDEVTWV